MDLSLFIDEYLKDKQHLILEDDSFNLALLESGDSSGWRFANIPCPSMDDLLGLQSVVESDSAQKALNEASLKFLADTDWMVIRQLENGTLVPQDVLESRAAARASIVK